MAVSVVIVAALIAIRQSVVWWTAPRYEYVSYEPKPLANPLLTILPDVTIVDGWAEAISEAVTFNDGQAIRCNEKLRFEGALVVPPGEFSALIFIRFRRTEPHPWRKIDVWAEGVYALNTNSGRRDPFAIEFHGPREAANYEIEIRIVTRTDAEGTVVAKFPATVSCETPPAATR